MAHYGDLPGALSYHTSNGNAAWLAAGITDGQRTVALVRGSAALDALYGPRFPGMRTEGRSQSLAWPRIGKDGEPIKDNEGGEVPSDEVPAEVEKAAYELALRELEESGSTTPDLDRGGEIKSLQAGSVGLVYKDSAPATTTFIAVDGLLSGLLLPRRSGTVVSFAKRA